MKMLKMRGNNNEDGTFDWKDAIADAAISGGLTFCTTLGALATQGPLATSGLVTAGIAAAGQFFAVLAIKRGLRPQE